MSILDAYDSTDRIVSAYNEMGIVKLMTVAQRMAVPAPTQASNRTIHDRCLEWGCSVTKTNGNWVWMTSPLGYRFKVRPPQQHEANGKFEIEAMLGALALPWAEFIAAEILDIEELKKAGQGFKRAGGPSEHAADAMGPCSVCEDDVMRAVMVKKGRKIAHSYCVKPKEAEPDTRFKLEPQPEPEPAPTEETEIVPEPDILEVVTTPPAKETEVALPRGRYINSVFDLLVERGDPMSNQAVAEVLSISPSQATSAMAQLASQGVVTRVKSGVYQAKPGLLRKAGTLGIVVSQEGERPFGTIPPNYHPVPTADLEQELVPFASEDEMLNELLDLIAPDGFKARHLPLIDQFKRCALALMRGLDDGA